MAVSSGGPSRILIVRLSALGDVVHCLPLLDALRRARPDAHIGWVVEDKAAALLHDHPQIDRLWVLPRAEIESRLRRGRILSALRLVREFLRPLRAARYELTIDPQCNLRSTAVSLLSGARQRIGFGRELAKESTHLLLTERVQPRPERSLKVQRNLELLRPLGIEAEAPRPRLAIPALTREAVRAKLGSSAGRDLVALHPGVSGFGSIKQWDPARFGAVAQRLADEAGARCLVTWGPGERELAREVVAASAGSAELAPETGSMLELAALLECCELVIGSDTGPVHLAAALGVPVVGLYGPKDPAVYGPWDARTGEMARVVRRPVHCSPCKLRTCPNVICMPAIGVDDVVEAATEELGRRTPASAASA